MELAYVQDNQRISYVIKLSLCFMLAGVYNGLMSSENRNIDPIEARILAEVPAIADPGEAEFWHLQAEKAPALLRKKSAETVAASQNDMRHFAFAGIAIGSIFGVVSAFAKELAKGKRIATGVAGALVAGGGLAIHFAQHAYANKTGKAISNLADQLQHSQELKNELANELHARVNTGAVERRGVIEPGRVEKEIALAIHDYAMDKVGVSHISITSRGKPLEPSHLGARNWEEAISKQKSDNERSK